MDFETRLFWASLDFLTIERISVLQRHFGNLEVARKHIFKEDLQKAGIPDRSVEAFLKKYKQFDFTKAQKAFEKSGAKLLYFEDSEFPTALRQIPDPPIFLFLKGNISPEDKISLSVVGTRKASSHGRQAIAHFLPDLISSGFTIVSGMARGIDAEAHRETLRRNGRTIAIWGTGIDVLYPQENARLAQEIQENGAILSEFPLGTGADPYNFPRRNRLISGCSLGTLVVEGEAKSGSLITAFLALEQGKEVFAVPGSPFAKFSEGPNLLIQRGEAKLIQTSADILNEFPFLQKIENSQKFIAENEMEEIICSILTKEPMTFDELVLKTQKPGFELSSALMVMSMKGMVTDLGMNEWARNF